MKQTFLSFLLMLLPMLASADAVEIGGIWYYLVNISKVKYAAVVQNPNASAYSGSYSGVIDIPAKITYEGTEFDVTSIESSAFSYCRKLSSITIPNSVTSIESNAFYQCSGLTAITIPNSVTSIGNNAFYQCSGLTTITIPNSVTSIGSEAFEKCNGLTSVHITDIEAWCNIKFGSYYSNPLSYAHKLYLNGLEFNDLVIPNSITCIESYAFSGCISLTSITIPNSVTSIGSNAFYQCSGLTAITIPNGVTSIGAGAFSGCSGLTSVNIPSSVTDMRVAFAGCSALSSIIVEDGNPKYDSRNNCNAIIETEANVLMQGCKSSTIPSSVTSIGEDAFANCSSLISITIPNSVTSIGWSAFYGCSGLISITIPNSLTSIEAYAFYGCSSLSSVIFGSGVTRIGGYSNGRSAGLTFGNCPELTEVTCLAENVPYAYENTFAGSFIEYATLHVPASVVDAYKSTEPWSNFKEIVAVDGSEIPETPKCATPTITYKNGKINFSCETEGVEYVSTISAGDTKSYFAGEITLTNKYTVSVYATKDGYDKSDTATLDIIGSAGAFGDLNEDGEVNVADHVELSKIILNKSK